MQNTAYDTLFTGNSIADNSAGSNELNLQAFALVNAAMHISDIELVLPYMNSPSTFCRALQNSAPSPCHLFTTLISLALIEFVFSTAAAVLPCCFFSQVVCEDCISVRALLA